MKLNMQDNAHSPPALILDCRPHSNDYAADVREVITAMEPVKPIYLYCKNKLVRKAQYFQACFPGDVSYAVKANPTRRVITTLCEAGISHFDVASIDEIKSVASISPNAILHFNNPVKASGAIASAYYDHGVRSFALDDMAELDKIMQATGQAQDILLSVRFKLDHQHASFDFGRKFGASLREAAVLLKLINQLNVGTALTFHPGSQCSSPETYQSYLSAAAEIAASAKVRIEQINVGGGFPVQYTNKVVPGLAVYFSAIRRSLSEHFSKPHPNLMCEPGRSMVAATTSLLAQVIHARADHSEIFINDGIYGGLQEQSIAQHPLPLKCWRGSRLIESVRHEVTIFGPTCDPTDRLPKPVSVPVDLRAGDYIEFGLMGAYGSATSTRFNGFCSNRYVNVERSFYDL